ncbi:recombinase family protein [Streptomyces chartreusis]|jgi:DNA invertase Pin-like site-specific DNA recombinase|uniref:recombinase family protein n=1 Tax=Streptomyces chartreusis TaxID=1969 RepID=UPI0037DD2990|nr:recombinase family protein [Streptomyces chartreusis]
MTEPRIPTLRLVLARRVSTAGQAVDGYGLDAQEADGRKWARLQTTPSVNIVHVVTDGDSKAGKSGTTLIDERPGLMDALQWIADGKADGILAPNLDRLARELTVQEAVLSYVWAIGGRVFTADHGEHLEDDASDPMRTAMRQMRGVFHQLDRGLIIKRLTEGRAAKGARGGYAYGSPRFGQRAVDKELTVDERENAIAELMERWRDEEGLGIRAIAARANAEGLPSKRGGRWHPTTVARVLSPAAREKARQQAAKARAERKEQQRRERAARLLAQR